MKWLWRALMAAWVVALLAFGAYAMFWMPCADMPGWWQPPMRCVRGCQ